MRNKRITLLLSCALLIIQSMMVFAEDYSFEIPDEAEMEQEERLEWGGNLDGTYTLLHTRSSSPLYGIQFFGEDDLSDYWSQYRLELYLNADYQRQDLGFHLKTYLNYVNAADAEIDDVETEVFELYGNLDLSLNASIQAGKIRYNWGKGYAFNPVGYVNSPKDPENPELARAGILSARLELLKSFRSDVLRTAALTTIFIPPQAEIKNRFGEAEQTDLAAKLYLMLWNIDLEFMGYYSKERPLRIGMDFALNLKENIELHGEFSYTQDAPKSTIEGNQLHHAEEDGASYVVGIRWLNRWNVTTILEYYHTDSGLTADEFEAYQTFLDQSLASGNAEMIRRAGGVSQSDFNSNTLMQDYVYLSLQKPEPFDWLYFTPSLKAIYNLHDQSALLSASLSYKPVTNFEFLFKPTFMVGADDSEYGSQRFQKRFETWLRFYF